MPTYDYRQHVYRILKDICGVLYNAEHCNEIFEPMKFGLDVDVGSLANECFMSFIDKDTRGANDVARHEASTSECSET